MVYPIFKTLKTNYYKLMYLKGRENMVILEFYQVDPVTGLKTPVLGNYNFGNIFKGNQKRVCFTIKNVGDTDAIDPVASIKEYPASEDGKISYEDAKSWKRLSFMETTNYDYQLQLPTIKAGQWLQGKDVYAEDFNNYPVVAGTPPDSTWITWKSLATAWEVYNGWLQHNVDNADGRACWTALPKAINFTYSMRVTIRNNVYGGVLLRHTGDYDTGYICLVQGIEEYLGDVNPNEGVIQIFSGTFSQGIESWNLLYTSGSIGIRGTHDYFKIQLEDYTFKIWYKNEQSETPLYTFTDADKTYKDAAQPTILCHAGFGSVLSYFDDIYMEVPNNNGVIWVQNSVATDTKVFGNQLSLLDISYGGVE